MKVLSTHAQKSGSNIDHRHLFPPVEDILSIIKTVCLGLNESALVFFPTRPNISSGKQKRAQINIDRHARSWKPTDPEEIFFFYKYNILAPPRGP